MLKEFREFIMRGNVLDLAVGIIIGAAFTSIVTSLVNDLIMPIIGLITGGVNFSDIFIPLKELPAGVTTLQGAKDAGIAVFAIGAFINAVINFLIIAFVVFMLVRAVNRMMPKKKEEAPAPAAPDPMLVEAQKQTALLETLAKK
jgi:large conductance mechanosensitive channel